MTDHRIEAIARDPEWLAHRYDPGHDAVHFVRTPRGAHARATFLTDEYLPADRERVVIRRQDAIDAQPAQAPLHFIFHSAYCCSTLLARALDAPGVAMGLKEPVILNDLVGWRHRGGAEPRMIARALDHSLTLLARPFGAREAVVVKPSNVVNGLATAILAMRPQAHAVLLYAPLDTYLRSIAKKEMTGRLWVRDLLVKLLAEGLVNLGLAGDDYLRLTDLQAAAVGWLAQHALFARLAEKYPDRVRTLDSETLLARPRDAMTALATHFALMLDVPAVVAGPVFKTNSKSGEQFGADTRAAAYAEAFERHGDEIARVAIWGRAVADNAGITFALPAPLIC